MTIKYPYFRMFPSDFLHGTYDLTPYECTVLTKVIMLIYDKRAPIPNDPVRIARQCNMRLPQCREAINSLIEMKKLILIEGKLFNERCEREIRNTLKKSSQGSYAAKIRWGKESKNTNENNDTVKLTQCRRNADAMPVLKSISLNSKGLEIAATKFDEFWNQYPSKLNRAAAKKAYERVVKEVSHEKIMAGLSQYTPPPESKHIPGPAKWLDEQTWADDPIDDTTKEDTSLAKAHERLLSRREPRNVN